MKDTHHFVILYIFKLLYNSKIENESSPITPTILKNSGRNKNNMYTGKKAFKKIKTQFLRNLKYSFFMNKKTVDFAVHLHCLYIF